MARKKQNNPKYYDIHPLMKLSEDDKNIKYLISFGERSAGKSYSTCQYILENYIKNGKETAIVRRWDDDWKQGVATSYWNSLIANGEVSKITNNKWDNIIYYRHGWYLAKIDKTSEKLIKDEKPFARAFSLSTWEKSKASQYPDCSLLVLEEFISHRYIGSEGVEFNYFLNLISTIARDRADFRCVLLGNTIAKFGNPYFENMGIQERVLKMTQGDTIVFSNDNNKLKIAVQYTAPPSQGKASDILFEFTDNSVSRQVTHGDWQINNHYPNLPVGIRIKPMDIQYKFYLKYQNYLLEGDVILQEPNNYYLFFHKKTTELQENVEDLIFSLEHHTEHNYRRDILRPTDKITDKIAWFFKTDNVFVQTPDIGEQLYSYIESI